MDKAGENAPTCGSRITIQDGHLSVPNNPVIPFIEGDGTGPDIWRAAQAVFDASVEKAYRGQRKIEWFEVYAGEGGLTQDCVALCEQIRAVDHGRLIDRRGDLPAARMHEVANALRAILDL